MGRTLSDTHEEKSPEKQAKNPSDSDEDSDLDEEEFIVEKIIKMRTTKKGKVQCEFIDFLHCDPRVVLLQIC